MAIWQWKIWIVPRKEVLKELSRIPTYLDQGWFESVGWWKNSSAPELIAFFDSVLRRYDAPWAKNTTSWGSDDGNRIELTIDQGIIENVSIRIDLRDLAIEFLRSLVNFSERNDFLLYSLESTKFIEPSLSVVLDEIQSSKKVAFLKDPKKFFDDNNAYLDRLNKENEKYLKKLKQ